jgi:Gas vesicle synthesis protein GvpO
MDKLIDTTTGLSRALLATAAALVVAALAALPASAATPLVDAGAAGHGFVVRDDPASVSSLAQVDGGWELMVDVVELRRVPDTASQLATYRVTTDDAGDIAGYERVRRFSRGEAD